MNEYSSVAGLDSAFIENTINELRDGCEVTIVNCNDVPALIEYLQEEEGLMLNHKVTGNRVEIKML